MMTEKRPSWPDGMDASERVRHVILTRTTPQNAGWIAEEAAVSRDTAVKYLTRMVEQDELKEIETDDGTCYKPDEVTQFLREVRRLAEENSMNELTTELRAIGDEIDSWKSAYGIESLSELRQSIGNNDLSGDDRRERLDVTEEWKYNIEVREAIQLAINLKQSLTSIETGSFIDRDNTGPLPQEG
jgi:hypothetical protein